MAALLGFNAEGRQCGQMSSALQGQGSHAGLRCRVNAGFGSGSQGHGGLAGLQCRRQAVQASEQRVTRTRQPCWALDAGWMQASAACHKSMAAMLGFSIGGRRREQMSSGSKGHGGCKRTACSTNYIEICSRKPTGQGKIMKTKPQTVFPPACCKQLPRATHWQELHCQHSCALTASLRAWLACKKAVTVAAWMIHSADTPRSGHRGHMVQV